ncbi:MAG: exosortase H-associated membrane protein [Candidatus Competibacteraceae bacterium]|jgi:hypothetical protein|nr:exosortase H-associated membrane protein [Candidatus Competibacteraceae bacterium]
MPEVSAKAFLGKILLWLPLSFATWYILASLLLWPVTLLVGVVFSLFYPGVIENVEQHGTLLDVNTRLSADQAHRAQQPSGQQGGQLYFTLNPLKFGYCLPLLLALQLATPGKLVRKLGLFAIGAVILVPVQAWGIYFETLVTLVFKTGPMIAQSMGTTALSREGIALAYQLGVLILPSVTPVLIWAILNQDFMVKLAGRPVENHASTDQSS